MVGLKHYTLLESMKAKAMINEKCNTHYYRTIPHSAQCTIIHSRSSQTKLKSVSSTPAHSQCAHLLHIWHLTHSVDPNTSEQYRQASSEFVSSVLFSSVDSIFCIFFGCVVFGLDLPLFETFSVFFCRLGFFFPFAAGFFGGTLR